MIQSVVEAGSRLFPEQVDPHDDGDQLDWIALATGAYTPYSALSTLRRICRGQGGLRFV